jgi:hypothetical protein
MPLVYSTKAKKHVCATWLAGQVGDGRPMSRPAHEKWTPRTTGIQTRLPAPARTKSMICESASSGMSTWSGGRGCSRPRRSGRSRLRMLGSPPPMDLGRDQIETSAGQLTLQHDLHPARAIRGMRFPLGPPTTARSVGTPASGGNRTSDAKFSPIARLPGSSTARKESRLLAVIQLW